MHFVVSLRPKVRVWLGIRRPRNLVVADEVANLDSKLSKANLVKGTGVCVCMCVRARVYVRAYVGVRVAILWRLRRRHFALRRLRRRKFCFVAPAAPPIFAVWRLRRRSFSRYSPVSGPKSFYLRHLLGSTGPKSFFYRHPRSAKNAKKFFFIGTLQFFLDTLLYLSQNVLGERHLFRKQDNSREDDKT